FFFFFFFQAEDGIRDRTVTGVQTCALPICKSHITSSVAPPSSSGWNAAPAIAKAPLPKFVFNDCWMKSSKRCAKRYAAIEFAPRSEERRVGKECRCRWWRGQ